MNELISLPLLAPLWAKLPHLPPLLRQWGDAPLGRIASGFADNPPGQAGQEKASSALLAAARSMTAPVLGDAVAEALVRRLAACPSVLAANYHGVECFPEMVQAIHFFALEDLAAEPVDTRGSGPVVPVLSCSSVSLQSQTYLRGLMLSRRDAEDAGYVHLPLFPSALQDVMASHAPALTEAQLRTMRALWFRKGRPQLLRWERAAVDAIMDRHVLRPDVLDLPTFGAQVTRVNASLCAERYGQSPNVRVVYLEMEALAARLLERDLEDEGSVMHRILFDPRARALVLDTLAGVRGCWRTEAINGLALGRTGRAGTIFFWMADEKGRRCPLRLCAASGETGLGFGDTCIPLRPAALRDALAAGTIVPSLFTSYMSLTLDHGLRCFGGIFLAEYLPTMIRGVASAMEAVGSPLRVAHPRQCLAALPLTVQIEDMGLRPAGSVELAAAGGLTRAHLSRIAQLTLLDVLPLSLASWYRDYVPAGERLPGWEPALERLASRWNGVTAKPLST